MSKNKTNLTKICICALLAALYVPIEMFVSGIGKIAFLDNYQIPFSCFPLILASIMFGIPWGTITAFVGSFVSQVLMYGFAFPSTIIWMIPTVIYGYTVALLYQIFRKNNNRILLGAQLFISSIILSLLNICANFVDSIINGWPYDFIQKFFAYIVSLKIIGGLIFAIIFAIVVPPIITKLKKILKF